MEEQLISFETAKLAKEKGFNIEAELEKYKYSFYCIKDFDNDWNDSFSKHKIQDLIEGYYLTPLKEDIKNVVIIAPPQSLLQKWLREIHKIYVDAPIALYTNQKYGWFVSYKFGAEVRIFQGDAYEYETYEEALEKALQEALKLI